MKPSYMSQFALEASVENIFPWFHEHVCGERGQHEKTTYIYGARRSPLIDDKVRRDGNQCNRIRCQRVNYDKATFHELINDAWERRER